MNKTPPKGTLFRHKGTGELWAVISTEFVFNSGMGGAICTLKRLEKKNGKNIHTSILWVNQEYGHRDWELVNGLERAIGKIKQHEKR